MSDRQFERAVNDWFEDGTDRVPEPAIEAVLLAVRTTPQERDLRIPWRPFEMPVNRMVSFAAAALVVVVGAVGLLTLTRQPDGVAAPTTTPTVTTTPTAAPTPASTPATSAATSGPPATIDVPAGFTTFTSPVYGYTVVYPDGWQTSPATSAGRSDQFVTADNDFGVDVGKRPAGGADVSTVAGLTAFAQTLCVQDSLGACDTYPDRVEELCLDAGGDACRPAILVHSQGKDPADEGEYAFFGDWANAPAGGTPTDVVVVASGRGDTYPAAAPFGGAVNLVKTMLRTFGVTASGGAVSAPGFVSFTSPLYGFTLQYPEGWVATPATVSALAGGGGDASSDTFVSPDNDIGFGARIVPVGDGSDVSTVSGLIAWAQADCTRNGLGGCDTWPDRVEVLCLRGSQPCAPAIIVHSEGKDPAEEGEYAYFGDPTSIVDSASPSAVVVVGVGRGDAYPGAARFGGAVALLKKAMEPMGIEEPGA